MDWEVSGTHMGTGRPGKVIVPGETAAEATANAAALGLRVAQATPRTGFMLVPMAAAAPTSSGGRPHRRSGWRSLYVAGALVLLVGSLSAMVGGFNLGKGSVVGGVHGADLLVLGIVLVVLAVPVMIFAKIGARLTRR